MVTGVTTGFVRKLDLVGDKNRTQTQNKEKNHTQRNTHPNTKPKPKKNTNKTTKQTKNQKKKKDQQQDGQVAADIRAFRPPEPYKGKGVIYSDEVIVRNEAKKK